MTQKLATRNSDNTPLDFGLDIVFDKSGLRAEGRSDNENYIGALFEGLTPNDVTLSDVADDYQIAGPPPPVDPYAAAHAAFTKIWSKKDSLQPHKFPALVTTAGISYGRIASDINGVFIRDTIVAPTLERIDPMDKDRQFFLMVMKMKTTNASDGQPLLSAANEQAIAAIWPNKPT